jgi:hypothetical protein
MYLFTVTFTKFDRFNLKQNKYEIVLNYEKNEGQKHILFDKMVKKRVKDESIID